MGRYYEAISYYDKALAINPNAKDILHNKGVVLITLGKYGEAIIVFDKILSLDPKNVAGLYNKGIALDKLGKHIEAKQYQDKALHINPDYSPSTASEFYNRISLAISYVPQSPI
jgi:tetratricopeptide (TPR) repeat protein